MILPTVENYLSFVGDHQDIIRKISIAPELEHSLELIEYLKDKNTCVSLGHTNATYEEAKAAIDAGATSGTHTYNAMPGIHHRAPGPIGAGSDSEGVYAELICDGKHIHASAVRMLIKIFGSERILLVSDSMKATDLGDGDYLFGGLDIVVKDGTALTKDGKLAGSTSSLFDCVKVAISFGIPEKTAVMMATENPARLMGLNKGKIEVGYDADFIIVDDSFNLIRAIVRGEL